MSVISQIFGNQTPIQAFDTPSTTPTNQGGSQASPSNQLTANSFITLLTTQLQAQDPLNPLDPNQMVNELTTMNTLQQIMQIRQDLDSLVAVAQNNGGPPPTGGTGAAAKNAAAVAALTSNGLVSAKL
jgi:hypothetical protein